MLKNKKVILMLFIAFAIRLAMFLGVKPWSGEKYNKKVVNLDAVTNNQTALNLLENHEYSLKKGELSSEVTPVYPSFLALIYLIFGYKPYMAVFAQMIIGALSCLLVYKLGPTPFDNRVGRVAGYLLAFEYISIMFEQVLYNYVLFVFLFLIAICFLAKFMKTDHKKYLAYVGVFLGIAALCRPGGLYFPLVLMLLFVFGYIGKNIKFTRSLGHWFIVVLFFCLTISPWLIRNYLAFEHSLEFTSRQTTALFFQAVFFKWQVWPSFKSIMANNNQLAKLFILFMITLFVMLYTSVVVGLVDMWRNKKNGELLLLISIIGYSTCIGLPLAAVVYRIQFMPYMMILAAYAIVELWSKYNKPATLQQPQAINNN